MIVIGLTGPSGAGKGYVCAKLTKRGIPCVDTDAIVHALYAPGTPCTDRLAAAFGKAILAPDGSVDRRALSGIVFADRALLDELNRIVHRYVLESVRRKLAELEVSGTPLAVVDAPQLFESGFDRECDVTVAVIAEKDVRLRRLTDRDGLPKERICARMKNQHDSAFFEQNCDFVLRNDGRQDVDAQIDAVLSRIGKGVHS